MKKKLLFLALTIITYDLQAQWQLTGNAGTNPNIHFIGTTDNADLVFKRGNIKVGQLGYNNLAFGINSLLNNTTGGNNIALGGSALYANTTGSGNIALGVGSLNSNTAGYMNVAIGTSAMARNVSGYYNTSVGLQALMENTTGYYNVATGMYALVSNTEGNNNTATGSYSLLYNTTGIYNTATGSYALQNSTIGSYNMGAGALALYSNTTGQFNVGTGAQTLMQNVSGSYNTSSGISALYNNTTGSGNTSQGAFSLNANTSGGYNTALGYGADLNNGGYSNATVIGSSAIGTASNQVRIGNSAVASIGGYTGWTNFSDGRFKKDIKEDVPGLAFINQLKPVTYHLDITGVNNYLRNTPAKDKEGKVLMPAAEQTDAIKQKEQVVYTGFIAQDVEAVAQKLNYSFSGVDAPKNSKDVYGLRYAEFVVPIVKSVQELSQENDKLKSDLQQLHRQFDEVIKQLRDIKASGVLTQPATTDQASSSLSSSSFGLKVYPNPTTGTFTIEAAQDLKEASIQLFDLNGKAQNISIRSINEYRKEIQLHSLAKGLYFLKLTTTTQTVSAKITVQ